MTGGRGATSPGGATLDMIDPIRQARQHSLGDLPRRSALRVPEKLAIIDGNISLTFTEFDALVDRTVAALQAAGLQKGERLALLAHNSWQFAVLDFATARAGVILVPVNFMLGASEIAFILDHSRAAAFVVESALIPVAQEAVQLSERKTVRLSVSIAAADIAHDRWEDVNDWFEHSGVPTEVPIADDDPVRMMFTSGTESQPKGAILTSRALLWQYVSCAIDGAMSADDIDLHTLPFYHCAQLDCFLGVDIYLGATSIILPAPNPSTVLSAIAEHKVTKYFAPPTVWISLLRSPEFDSAKLSTLRKGYYGASPMPVAVLEELRERLPHVDLWNFYGQTELAPIATVLQPSDQKRRAGSAGRPVLNVETRIVDDEDRPVPAGTVGEIVHRSPQATIGYFDQDAVTAAAFGGGWFHSGDLGYLTDDRYLYVVDRKKDMIKTGGENVASREVEETIYGLESVAEVAVFGIPHPHWVEAVTAVVVPKNGHSLTVDTVIDHVHGLIAGYKSPKYVVIADELPKNPSGKILKRELRRIYSNLAQQDTM
jgi:fatty-acyl-CoA synthase